MRRCGLTFLLSILAIWVGCEHSAPPHDTSAKNDELSETLEQIKQDEHVQRLKEYADKRMERLLTKTGEGVKTIDWDLSKDNHISLVAWPEDEGSDEYIINQDIDLSIRFPAGFSVKERATLLICDREEPTLDRLYSISFHLPKCTTDEAFQIAKDYITRWKLQKYFTTDGALRALDVWYAKAKDGSAGIFLAARHDNYPMIDVQIIPFYDSDTWFISIYFSISKPPLPTDVVACFDAIRTGDVSTVTKLIEGGLNPTSQNTINDSLLHQAAKYGRIELVECLIEKGAHVGVKGSYKQTPFWEAILGGHLDVAQLFLDKGADIDSGSTNRGTVLHFVCEYIPLGPVPNHKLARWLIDQGAKVDVVNNRGDTPLHKSAWKGHVAAATVLISAGANVNAKNKKGMTPLDNALNQRQTEMEQLLRKHDAQIGGSDDRT